MRAAIVVPAVACLILCTARGTVAQSPDRTPRQTNANRARQTADVQVDAAQPAGAGQQQTTREKVGAAPASGIDAESSARSPNTVQPQDSLNVAVANQPDLTRKYVVEQDGHVLFPLIGSVQAAGLTADQLTTELRRRFGEYLKTPEVSIEVVRPRRVFVFGAVKSPGTYPLVEAPTLLELLARAGSGEASAATVVRTKGAAGPVMPEQAAAAQVVHVNLRQFEKEVRTGDLSGNVELDDGDTVWVPRSDPDQVHVVGQVRHPGAYAIPNGTTVLQALTLAGGPTEHASVGGTKISRVAGNALKSTRARLDDLVQPGDSVIVPEGYRFPVIFGRPDPWSHPPGEIRVTPGFSLLPAFAIRRVGIDTDVSAATGSVQRNIGGSAGPQLDALMRLGGLRLHAGTGLDFAYYVGQGIGGASPAGSQPGSQSFYPSATVDGELAPSRRLSFYGSWTNAKVRDYYGQQVDARVLRHERGMTAGVRVRPLDRLSFDASGAVYDSRFDRSATFLNVSLRDTLTERIEGARVAVQWSLTADTSVSFEGGAARHRFEFFPAKNADATEFAVTLGFRLARDLSSGIRIGRLRYITLDPSAGSFVGPVGRVNLGYTFGRTQLLAVGERTTASVFQRQFAYSVVDRYGGSVFQALPARFDIRVDGFREIYHQQAFASGSTQGIRDRANRYVGELGWRATGTLRVFVDAEYIQQVLNASGFPGYHALRWWGGMSYGGLGIAGISARVTP